MQSDRRGLGEKEEGESGWLQRFEHLYGQTVGHISRKQEIQKGKTVERGDYELSWALTVHMDRDTQSALGSVGLALEDTWGSGDLLHRDTGYDYIGDTSSWVGDH